MCLGKRYAVYVTLNDAMHDRFRSDRIALDHNSSTSNFLCPMYILLTFISGGKLMEEKEKNFF